MTEYLGKQLRRGKDSVFSGRGLSVYEVSVDVYCCGFVRKNKR
jgi:hypothetical protein